ncbi:MAG: Uma2 family endonuclease [Caulobacterales bacterium]|nr:Uma2 family endonuclease [Caulobacterales bacterium]
MSDRRVRKMTADAFLAWEASQEEKWELVDGAPLRRRARLTGEGTRDHSRITTNLGEALQRRLRGGECVVCDDAFKVASATGSVRYPEVVVDGARGFGPHLVAEKPRAVFEVISPKDTFLSVLSVLEDFQAIDSVEHIVFVTQGDTYAQVWTREGAVWRRRDVEGPEAELELPALNISLPLVEAYEGAPAPVEKEAVAA